MKVKDMSALFLLAAMWGASFLFMRIAAPVLGPFLVIELRVLIAGLALLLYALLTRKTLSLKSRWKNYLVIGAINSAIPFTLIATATLTLNASLASVLNSTTPLFTALVAYIWLKESLTFKKVLAIILGIIGVFILLGWSPINLSTKVVLSAILSLGAAVSYAFGGVYVKKTFKGIDALSLNIGQQLSAALILFPIAVFNVPKVEVSRLVVFSIAALALVCTALAYIFYFYLIANVGPTKTLSVTLLVPVFGVIWGAIFLKESITVGVIGGLVIILMSIIIMSGIKLVPTRNENLEKAEIR